MMEDKISITVLMSVFNENDIFLKKSIESILNQTFKNFEFLIIDDGTTDETCLSILKKFEAADARIRLIKNKTNLGLTRSLNKGISLAKGKYIARIDSDDMSKADRLEKQLKFMKNNSDYALCGSWSYIIDENGEIIGKKKFFSNNDEIKKNILYFNFFTHSSLFFVRELVVENGGYNEKIKKSQDYDLILRLSGRYPIANIPEFLCFHRISPESISSKSKKRQEWYGIISRLRAVLFYGHSRFNFYKIIPALFYFLLIPHSLEKIIFKFMWKK